MQQLQSWQRFPCAWPTDCPWSLQTHQHGVVLLPVVALPPGEAMLLVEALLCRGTASTGGFAPWRGAASGGGGFAPPGEAVHPQATLIPHCPGSRLVLLHMDCQGACLVFHNRSAARSLPRTTACRWCICSSDSQHFGHRVKLIYIQHFPSHSWDTSPGSHM